MQVLFRYAVQRLGAQGAREAKGFHLPTGEAPVRVDRFGYAASKPWGLHMYRQALEGAKRWSILVKQRKQCANERL
ncbi:MAG: hypothetical protein KDA95_06945 [Acidimicrobiales bacterium]|nr:hypothetical protein [Acidimicrobiales bacterium]